MKKVKIFFACIILVLVFSSCEQKAAAPGEQVVTVMANAVKGGVNSQAAEWFEEVIPELSQELQVKIQYIPVGVRDEDYKARAALDIKGGKGPDILDLDQFWVPEFADAGFIRPLGENFNTWELKDQLYDSIQKMGQYKSQTYMVIWNTDLRMIYYHKEILSKSGINLPWKPGSWQDILDAARKIKQTQPDIIPFQIDAGTEMGEATAMQGFYMALLGARGSLYDWGVEKWIVDSPAIREALQFYKTIYVDESLGSKELQLSSKSRDKSFELFRDGKIAMYVEGTWMYVSVLAPGGAWALPDMERKIGWAPMPGDGKPGSPPIVCISGGDGLTINKNSVHPELAWKVIAALNSLPRMARLFDKKPFTPTRKDITALPAVQANEFIARTAETLVPITTFRPGLPAYPKISFRVQYLTEQVISGTPIDQAIKEFDGAVEGIVGPDKVMKK